MEYWITYTDGSKSTFEADTRQQAYWHFMMEGDHAFEYGKVEEEEDNAR